jgi:AraC-like DNA-binding protein
MQVFRKALFQNDWLQISLFEARPTSDACGDVERQSLNAIVLPLSGVFSKHDRPGQHVIGTPSHAVFFGADKPYRIGFPGGIGDRAITLRFADELVPEYLDPSGDRHCPAPHGLLPPGAMVLRNFLLRQLQHGNADEFEIETLGLDLLNMALCAVRSADLRRPRPAEARRMTAVARVKEAVALAPAARWSVAKLAKTANMSPFHLCRTFRQIAGTSVYDYVLRERLAHALHAVLERSADLTTIAFDAGFASHSHFTARFRQLFGSTPNDMRRVVAAGRAAELRKIMTALKAVPALD